LYVESARPLRALLAKKWVEEVRFVDERTFGGLVTYPTITTLVNTDATQRTTVIHRDRTASSTIVSADDASWLPRANGEILSNGELRLRDICLRVSCGVATGADGVFVRRTKEIERELLPFAYPTVAGRELTPGTSGFSVQHSMLIPYSRKGQLLGESALGALKSYLESPARRARLMRRICVRRKPWYAFHETPPFPLILQPKILCKDIAARPQFWISTERNLVPRHSVYYMIPKDAEIIEALCEYLNSATAEKWLISRCQRAANGFIRLQSHVLKQLPLPAHLAAPICITLCKSPMSATPLATLPSKPSIARRKSCSISFQVLGFEATARSCMFLSGAQPGFVATSCSLSAAW
jgi:hypothetical protein